MNPMALLRLSSFDRSPLLTALILVSASAVLPGSFAEAQSGTLRLSSKSESARVAFRAAMRETHNIRDDKAVAHLDAAISHDPGFGLARAARAFIDPDLTVQERRTALRGALESMGTATAAEQLLAQAWQEWSNGRLDRARDLLAEAKEKVPEDPHVAYYHVQALGAVEPPARTIAALRDFLEEHPEFGPAYNQLGYALYQSGSKSEGLEAIARYTELESEHPNSHDSYAEMLAWEGRFEEALGHYQRAVELDPDWLDGWVGQAEVLQATEQGAEARVRLRKALEAASEDRSRANFQRAIANSFFLDGDRSGSVEALEFALEIATEQEIGSLAALCHRELALVDAYLGEGNTVDQHLGEAERLDSGNRGQQLAFAALAYHAAGDARKTLGAVRGLELATGDFWKEMARRLRAMIAIEDGDAQAALANLERTDQSDLMTRALTAQAYSQLEREEAADELKLSVVSDPRINFYNMFESVARYWASR